jgi:hypothetical protein
MFAFEFRHCLEDASVHLLRYYDPGNSKYQNSLELMCNYAKLLML